MNLSTYLSKHSSGTVAKVLASMVAVILVLVPFHAFLTVWGSSVVGHYTLLRLWKECLLLVLIAGSLYLLAKDASLRQKFLASILVRLIILYLFVQLVWGIVAYALHGVTGKALAYGWIVDCRFLLFFLAVWVIAAYTPSLKKHWSRLLFWPAAVVCLFGLLQYFVLPNDVLKHVGYGAQTIAPYETINNNVHYIRIMSTLRGANPLGAYLVVVLGLLFVAWRAQKRFRYVALGLAGMFALLLSFSRSAWLGFLVSAALVVWLGATSARRRKIIGYGGVMLVGIVAIAFLAFRHDAALQNAVFHTDDHSKIATSSNQGHQSALKGGLHDIAHEPLGRGPGTAGPASPYNSNKVRIAENYYVQVGQEVGWFGLALFLIINYMLAKQLWVRRQQLLAFGLFAAFVGLVVVNMLSHAWADDTLAYLWWGLAGVALSAPGTKQREI